MIVSKNRSGDLDPLTQEHYEQLARDIQGKEYVKKAETREAIERRIEDLQQKNANLELSVILSKPSDQRTPEEKDLLYQLTLEALTPYQ